MLSKGVTPENIVVISHGQFLVQKHDKTKLRKKMGIDKEALVLGTHGFASEYEGFDKVIDAITKLQNEFKN
ncbi:MAG: hypothetical protein LBH37_04735 [Oscillospiraceae bacterium]|nr:hypothetical protein [Oscillospiraceae bacterium]